MSTQINSMAHHRLVLFLLLLFTITTANAVNLTPTPHPDSPSTNPKVLLITSLAAAMSESVKLSSLLSAAGSGIVENQRGTLQDCRELNQITVNALRRSVTKVNAGGLADAGVYLSAALSNQDTCLEGLHSASGYMKSTVVKSVVRIYDHVNNSLSYLSFLQALGGSKRARQASKRDRMKITVALDGTGNFSTISEAVRFAPSHSHDRILIYVKEGIYVENVEIPRHKTNIVLIGSGSQVTVVTGSRSVSGGWTIFRSATVGVSGDGFLARDMRFENSAGPESQHAVALRINADLSALYRCSITGCLGALHAHSFRQFYRECDVSGTVDYIFGGAAAVFQASKIISRLPRANDEPVGNYSVITAQYRSSPHAPTGFSLQNCSIVATQDLDVRRHEFKSYLGRPPEAFSRTVIMKSYISDFIDPSGWVAWPGCDAHVLETLYYGEYFNHGPRGAMIGGRVQWGGFHVDMDYKEAYNFTLSRFIAGDEWLNSTGFPYHDYRINCTTLVK